MSETFLYSTKKNNGIKLNVWCMYPAVYNFAMSALGYLTVVKHIDELEYTNVERVYTDTEKTLLQLRDIDLITFSFSFELDCLGIFQMLDKYEIPFLAKDRDESYPLICAGGPVVSANPEPYAELFDFIMTGDCENNIADIINTVNNKTVSKQKKLELLSGIEGVYIPQFKKDGYKVIKSTSKINSCTSTPILSEKSFFPNTYIIELERGCTQKCGFCLTSYINTPIRFCPYEEIIKKIDTGLKYTNKIALLGAIICAHPRIDDIAEYIIEKTNSGREIEVTVSSLRADYVSDKVLEMLHKCGQRTATIAVEAGSERLRNIINKDLKTQDILTAVDKMVSHGFTGLKIYGILGLPKETYEDLDSFVNLCKEIKQKYKSFNIIPSFSTFVPKAQTPFQFAKREDTKTLEKKNEYIKKQFAKIGIKARTSSVKWDFIQTLLSRGSRELTPYLTEVYKQGGNIGAFKNVYKEFEKKGMLQNADITALNEIDLNKELPWDFIEYPNGKEALKAEYKRLMAIN